MQPPFEFDPAKDAANRLKHGLSLADFSGFDSLPVIIPDVRRDYGERRDWAVGRIDGRGHILTFTRRGDIMRLISLRRAHEKEMKRYGR
jgi:uncharacterized protein